MTVYLETNSDGAKSQGYLNSGRIEGIGAIAQCQLLLYAICKKLGVEYYSSGFKNIGHSSYTSQNIEEWSDSFTEFFNLSTNNKIDYKYSFSEIGTEFFNFVETNKNNFHSILIYLEPESVLQYGQTIIPEIFEKKYLKDLKYNFAHNQNFDHNVLNVSFHIRNINSEDTSFQSFREYYDTESIFKYKNLIEQIHKVSENEKVKLHIHSQGSSKEFEWVLDHQKKNFEIDLHLNDHPIHDIYCMSFADLLVMSNSSFSWIAHLLNYNVTLVRDNFWHSTYPNTLKLDHDYSFNTDRLKLK